MWGGVLSEKTMVQLLLFADNLMYVAEKDKDVERNLKMLNEVMRRSDGDEIFEESGGSDKAR